MSFALTSSLPKPNPLLQDSACTSCGTWEVGSSPAAALLGWRVPKEAQRLVPRKYHCLSPGSSWQAQFCTPPFPFSSLSVAEGRETHIFFPHPASPPSPPPCTLLAPGSCEAIPDEMALSLALTTRGKAALCMPCQDADEGKEPSPHKEQQGGSVSQAWSSVYSYPDSSAELPLIVPASPMIRNNQYLCLPEFFPKSHRTRKTKFLRVILYICLTRQNTKAGVEHG